MHLKSLAIDFIRTDAKMPLYTSHKEKIKKNLATQKNGDTICCNGKNYSVP